MKKNATLRKSDETEKTTSVKVLIKNNTHTIPFADNIFLMRKTRLFIARAEKFQLHGWKHDNTHLSTERVL